MLYGNEKIRNQFIRDAENYAKENGLKLVFGSMCGSISKGMQYFDSDYDTRFLFVREDFPEKICYTPQAKEAEMVYRFYPEETLPYEWIPFWELTSFLQYLVMPGLDDKFSLGLYNIVSWTLKSPYTWDPYGIQNRITPIMDHIFIKEYKTGYHVNEITQKIDQLKEQEIVAKNYLHMVYSALIIEYCINYNTAPPTDTRCLMAMSKYEQLYNRVSSLIKEAGKRAFVFTNEGHDEMHDAHFTVRIKQDSYVSRYIDEMYQMGLKVAVQEDFLSEERKRELQVYINRMYQIINDAMQPIAVRNIS